ncbi:metallophosphoesterase family protein [Pseudovibrio sp. Tun.PSC04-5.I4]|uniref:metallophosphoesterase family protein n=1 Tax=Pseudovibrio sp. Tun.PSC04-5.I4 TaxID=1798213 RepID=UPI00088BFBE9|nr:metallophosphoesterase family protein [Pseudovibrio sp. Tun.PSC04-5.I4]SDR32657.1 serine/threonine protein phosphatase 1 [Pseudovibrio sp. Tun.PSC04-5.I4]
MNMTIFNAGNSNKMQPPNPSLPKGTRIYAVGDIHGRFDLLTSMGNAIERDLKKRPVHKPMVVYLGDYIDRGPDSQKVIEFLINHHKRTPKQLCLKGNHEAALLEFLEDPSKLYYWEGLGGIETLLSYGLSHHDLMGSAEAECVQTTFKENLPITHLNFLKSLSVLHKCGDYLFVHAGLRPEVPIEEQSHDDNLWIRSEFLNYQGDFGAFVVHGHTPVERIDHRTNRLAVDTEAYASDRLTCAVLEGETMKYIEATPDSWELFDLIPNSNRD